MKDKLKESLEEAVIKKLLTQLLQKRGRKKPILYDYYMMQAQNEQDVFQNNDGQSSREGSSYYKKMNYKL